MRSLTKKFLILLLAVANCSIVFCQTNYWQAIVDVEPESVVEDAWYGNGSLPMFNVSAGYGMFKSVDAGKTWEHIGQKFNVQ